MNNDYDIEDSNLNHDVEIEQVLRPKLFTDFEGQDQIVDNLKVFIGAARKRDDEEKAKILEQFEAEKGSEAEKFNQIGQERE